MARVIKTIGGRQYYYEQHSYRVNGKVKTISKYLGPVNPRQSLVGFIKNQIGKSYGIDWDAIERQQLEIAKQDMAKMDDFTAKMHAAYGMRFDTPAAPIEKVSSPVAPASFDRPQAPDVPDSAGPEASPEVSISPDDGRS